MSCGGSLTYVLITSDRNAAVRHCNARQLLALVETVGTASLLSLKKGVLSNFLSAVSRLPRDASQDVRWVARLYLPIHLSIRPLWGGDSEG